MGLDYEATGNGMWGLFARVKYLSAKQNGSREPGQRPDDLKRAAEMLRESLELCWRAGYKSERLVEEMERLTR